MSRRTRTIVAAFAITTSPLAARAQDEAPSAHAHRRTGPIAIDGNLDEKEWTDCPPVKGFVQRFPDPGKTPTHDTEFRVSYDDDAIYVAVRARDDRPDRIRGLLTRRDLLSSSDWIIVGIDSYHDKRTAYAFGVNPAGVQRDMIIYDDTQVDDSWDAVWTAKTAIDADGWTAEFRIPLSQLRFSPEDAKSWGFQVQRIVQRTGEEDVWSPWPRASTRIVSRFGTLDGIHDLAPPRRLELLPYVTGGGVLEESIDPADPYMRTARGRGNAGLDLKYGLGSAFTLAATINPDFGQVEADPSQVNLTGNELFYAEKRPFFVEGTDIFQYGLGQGDGPSANDALFYTRRIGATPHADLSDYAYVDAPSTTTIYGAAKVSGKTASGWSLGVLDAVTGEETARVDDGAGMRTEPVVEPLSNYAVARVKRDLRGGQSTIGGAVTATDRSIGDDPLIASTMHDQAYAGGLQLTNKLGEDDDWQANVRLFGSWVHGTAAAINDTETDLRHLFQRPDQHYLHLDPNATSLAGSGALVELGKFEGEGWRYYTGIDTKSPGLEVNDLGFQARGDYYLQWANLEYRSDTPSPHLVAWSASANAWVWSSWEPQIGETGYSTGGHVTFPSYWDVAAYATLEARRWDWTALRGGPDLRENNIWEGFVNVTSDTRKSVYGNFSVSALTKPVNDSWNLGFSGAATIQARSNLDLNLGPMIMFRTDDSQYVDQIADDTGTTRYVFGRIHEVVTSLTIRANWTFSPHLSLQVYAMPFVATGRYTKLKEAADTRNADYAARFHVFGDAHELVGSDTVMVDRDGNGTYDYSFDNPDFTLRQLRSTAVLRWEYRPGSTLFVIWSHDGEGSDVGDGRYRFSSDLSRLARQPGEDVVMMKLNYWVGL